MAKKMDETIKFKIPKKDAKKIHERIFPFLELYNKEQIIQTRFFEIKPKNEFDLLSLCYSCYTQGLKDASDVLNNNL